VRNSCRALDERICHDLLLLITDLNDAASLEYVEEDVNRGYVTFQRLPGLQRDMYRLCGGAVMNHRRMNIMRVWGYRSASCVNTPSLQHTFPELLKSDSIDEVSDPFLWLCIRFVVVKDALRNLFRILDRLDIS
jgi:hypothetical protein